jgi:hypothetical protein
MEDLDGAKRLPDTEPRLARVLIQMIVRHVERIELRFFGRDERRGLPGRFGSGRFVLFVLVRFEEIRRDALSIPDHFVDPIARIEEVVTRFKGLCPLPIGRITATSEGSHASWVRFER